jgi:hypothetical protein
MSGSGGRRNELQRRTLWRVYSMKGCAACGGRRPTCAMCLKIGLNGLPDCAGRATRRDMIPKNPRDYWPIWPTAGFIFRLVLGEIRYYDTAMSRPKPLRHRPCQIWRHSDRLRIELLRLSGTSLDQVAARFQVHRDALHRHMMALDDADRAALIADLPMKELARQAAEEGVSLIDYFKVIREVLMRQLLTAASSGDRIGTASLSGRAIECLKELGRVTGEISNLTAFTVNNNTAVFVNSPQFAQLETMLIERLAKYPDALAEVVAGLRELEAKAAPEGHLPAVARPYMTQHAQGAS